MQLIVILLTTVSVLTFLSSVIVLFGSHKKDRVRSLWYSLAAIFATIWMVSISFFLIANDASDGSIHWHIIWTFISAVLLDIAFLGYSGWNKKYGKVATIFFFVFGLTVSGLIFFKHESFYSEAIIANTGNSIKIVMGPLYFSYIAFFATVVPAIIYMYLRQFLSSSSKRKRGGDIVTMISYGTSSLVILVCNLILPLLGNWGMIWLGPLALAVTIISVYYTILRYRMLTLSSIWLKLFSHIINIASIAILYMIIFSLVFAALFRGSTPSIEVIVLNFIMILIFIALIPAINELFASTRNLINGNKTLDKDFKNANEDSNPPAEKYKKGDEL